jgi:hypothetical protein
MKLKLSDQYRYFQPKAHRIIETSIRRVGEFSVAENNDGPVRASSTSRRRETDCVVEAHAQGTMGLGDVNSVAGYSSNFLKSSPHRHHIRCETYWE